MNFQSDIVADHVILKLASPEGCLSLVNAPCRRPPVPDVEEHLDTDVPASDEIVRQRFIPGVWFVVQHVGCQLELRPPIPLGRITVVLAGLFLGLGAAWRYREVGLNLWDRGTVALERLVIGGGDFLVELAYRASLPEPEVAVINGLMVAGMALVGLGLGLYLRAESRGMRLYAHQLTGRP